MTFFRTVLITGEHWCVWPGANVPMLSRSEPGPIARYALVFERVRDGCVEMRRVLPLPQDHPFRADAIQTLTESELCALRDRAIPTVQQRA